MNIGKNHSLFYKGILTVALFVLITALTGNTLASNPVTLKVYEGFRFSTTSITKSGDKTADISFYVNRGRQNAGAFALGTLGANKIKEFGKTKPDVKALTVANVSGWKDYANAPSSGYYVALGSDGKTLYLVNVISFKNQGKAASFWTLTFTWEKI